MSISQLQIALETKLDDSEALFMDRITETLLRQADVDLNVVMERPFTHEWELISVARQLHTKGLVATCKKSPLSEHDTYAVFLSEAGAMWVLFRKKWLEEQSHSHSASYRREQALVDVELSLRAQVNQCIELLSTALHEPEQITEEEIHDLRSEELRTKGIMEALRADTTCPAVYNFFAQSDEDLIEQLSKVERYGMVEPEQIRVQLKDIGITSDSITDRQLHMLHRLLSLSLKHSQLFDGTFEVQSKVPSKFMKCKSSYFEQRELVSFGQNGFVHMAGWASSANVQPICRAFLVLIQHVRCNVS